MGAFVLKALDHFDNGVIDFTQGDNFGKMSESGTEITLTTNANDQWKLFGNGLAPVGGYGPVGAGKIYRYETRLTSLVPLSTGHVIAGLTNDPNQGNPRHYFTGLLHTASAVNFYAYGRYTGIQTTLYNQPAGSFPNGGDGAFIFRQYWARSTTTLTLAEDGYVIPDTTGINDSHTVGYASADNGLTWTRVYAQQSSIASNPADWGICCYNNDSSTGGGTVKFDYLARFEWEDEDPDGPLVVNKVPAPDSANVNVEDDITFSVTDVATNVDIDTVKIDVDDIRIFANDTFIAGWTYSSYVANASNGFDFTLRHDNVFLYETTIDVDVFARDIAFQSVQDGWSFETGFPPEPIGRHQLTVDNIQIIGTPKPINRLNQFDEHGSLVGLPRLRGEKNYSYRRRIQDTMVHRANSSYRGMVNGVTRELGLSLFEAMLVNPKRGDDGQFLAEDPYIAFDGVYLLLYSNLANNDLDWAIDRYQLGGNYEHLVRLVEVVNDTGFFEAELLPDVDPYLRSMSVLNQSNRNEVTIEFVPESTRFRLKHRYPVRGAVFFANRDTFRTEVTTATEVTGRGKYHVDYTTGIVTVYTVPRPREYVRYRYTQYPFRALASPVILHDINRESFRVKMFEQVLQDNGEFAHGLPTELGVDIINELMSVSPMYWGI